MTKTSMSMSPRAGFRAAWVTFKCSLWAWWHGTDVVVEFGDDS